MLLCLIFVKWEMARSPFSKDQQNDDDDDGAVVVVSVRNGVRSGLRLFPSLSTNTSKARCLNNINATRMSSVRSDKFLVPFLSDILVRLKLENK